MDSPLVKATVQSTLLGALSNVMGQLIGCWQSKSPYGIDIHELMVFMAFSIISCPPNYLWQTWLEETFPGYTSPNENEKLVDETVAGQSTTRDKTGPRNRDEKQAALSTKSVPNPQKAKKQLSIRNTVTKFLLDQGPGAAVNTVMFIMGIAMLRGESWQSAVEETKTGFWPLVFAGQKLWPVVSIISLTLVPVENRMVFGSTIGVGWGIFLSLMAGGKKKKH